MLLLVGLCFAVLLYLSIAPALFNDGDTSWHLAAGRWMIDTGSVPSVDPFSFTAAGQPWTAHEWLAEAIMAAMFRLGSWGALSLLFATSVAALLFILGLEARRWLPSPLALAALLLAVFIVLVPYIVARPHVLAWPLLASWTIALLRAREARRAPPFAAALLMLVWANLHASFLFGLALIAPFALEALLESEERRPVVVRWGAFGLVSLLAALATPHGVDGLLFPLQVSAMASLPLIIEWRPTMLSENRGFEIVLIGTIAFALYKGVKLPLIRLLLLAGILYLAFEHVRHQAVLAIVGALLLARPISEALGRERPEAPKLRSLGRGFAALGLAALVAMWAVRLAIPIARQDSRSNPVTAIARVPAPLRAAPVLNAYGFGGPLILNGIRPYIDGRADMYGDAFVIEHRRMVDGDWRAFARAVERWRIGWTILPPGAGLVARLDRHPVWRRVYADRWAVIHVAAARAGS